MELSKGKNIYVIFTVTRVLFAVKLDSYRMRNITTQNLEVVRSVPTKVVLLVLILF